MFRPTYGPRPAARSPLVTIHSLFSHRAISLGLLRCSALAAVSCIPVCFSIPAARQTGMMAVPSTRMEYYMRQVVTKAMAAVSTGLRPSAHPSVEAEPTSCASTGCWPEALCKCAFRRLRALRMENVVQEGHASRTAVQLGRARPACATKTVADDG